MKRLALLVIFLASIPAAGERSFARSPYSGGVAGTPASDARPELGVRLGAFMVYPRLNAGLEYSDNIYAVKDGGEADWIAIVGSGVTAASMWSRHQMKLDAGLRKGFFANNAKENYLDARILLGARFNIVQRSYIETKGGYESYYEQRGDPKNRYFQDSDARYNWAEPARYEILSASVKMHHETGRFFMDAGAETAGYVHKTVETMDGGRLRQDYRNRVEYTARAQLGYEWLPKIRPFVRAEYNWREYAGQQEEWRQNSDGYRIGAGTKLYLGGVTTGEAWGGYLRQKYDYDRRVDISGVWYGGALTWEATRLTTVRAWVDRKVRETSYYRTSGIESTIVDLSIHHELFRNLLPSLALIHIRDEYKGVDINDEHYAVRPGLIYRPNRNLDVDFHYEFVSRKSSRDKDLREFEVNRVVLSLTGFY